MWPIKVSGEPFESFASVVLRVPGIFLIDYWWQYGRSSSVPQSAEWVDVAGAALAVLVPIQGLLLLLLRLEHLVDLYMYYIGASLLAIGHLFSQHYILVEKQSMSMAPLGLAHYLQEDIHREQGYYYDKFYNRLDHNFLTRQFAAILIQVAIAATIAFLLDLQHSYQRMILAAYALPIVARFSGFLPDSIQLQDVHNLSSAVVLLFVIYSVLKYVPTAAYSSRYLCEGWLRSVRAHGGLGITVSTLNSLFVPMHFLLFWSVQMAVHLHHFMTVRLRTTDEWYLILLRCISDVCSSPISLVSTAVAISYASYFLLTATKLYLQGYRAFLNDNLTYSGWTEGLTMVLTALQTGLVDIRMPHRAAVMTVLLFIVVSSIIQSMFEITEPFLLALSASRSQSIWKHIRTLALCCLLFSFPLYVTYVLCDIFPVDFWMLVVVSSCIMTSIQVLGLVSIYVLFMYDAVREEHWDGLDDVVYYARAVTRVLEFMVAVFVVGAGLHESIANQWSWINSSVLVVHCYFNVWQRLQSGWKSFLLRREAVRKIESLPVASEAELKRYGDICAICYGEMKIARVTSCKHIYHANCLRKWLYVQDKCPMCHATITQISETETEAQQSQNSPQEQHEDQTL